MKPGVYEARHPRVRWFQHVVVVPVGKGWAVVSPNGKGPSGKLSQLRKSGWTFCLPARRRPPRARFRSVRAILQAASGTGSVPFLRPIG